MKHKSALRCSDGMELVHRFGQRSLRMAAGGEMPIAGAGRGLVNPAPVTPDPGLPAQPAQSNFRMDSFGNNMTQADKYKQMSSDLSSMVKTQAGMDGFAAAPATPQPIATAPMNNRAGAGMQFLSQPSSYGLKHGGDLRTGMGGDVPGQGHGDKIPAKYEPGEFVVSNDMLEAQPGLRESLRELRADVLAEKGMTPAEADAKAVTGSGLRAAGSFNMPPFVDLTLDDLPPEKTTQLPAVRNPQQMSTEVRTPPRGYIDVPSRVLYSTPDTGGVGAVGHQPNNNLRLGNDPIYKPAPLAPDRPTIAQMNASGEASRAAQRTTPPGATQSNYWYERGAPLAQELKAGAPRVPHSMTRQELFSRGTDTPGTKGPMKFSVPNAAAPATPAAPTPTPAAPAAPAAPAGTLSGSKYSALRNAGAAIDGAGRVVKAVGPAVAGGALGYGAARLAQGIDNPADRPNGNYVPSSGASRIPGGGYDNRPPEKQKYNYFTDTDVGRNIKTNTSALAAVPGLGLGTQLASGAFKTGSMTARAVPAIEGAAAVVAGGASAGMQSDPITRGAEASGPAPYNPNQTAATALRTGMSLDGRSQLTPARDARTLNMDPSRRELGQSRDFSNELNGARGPLPTDLREGVIHKTKDAQGRTTYSGRNVSGDDAQFVDGMGKTLKRGGNVSIVPGMSKELIDQTLTNPDGSRVTRADIQTQMANLRDGVDQFRGTSQGQMGGATIIGRGDSDLSIEGIMKKQMPRAVRTQMLNALAAREQNQTNLRSQDRLAATALENNKTLRRGQDLEYQGKMAPLEVAKANQRMLRELASHPSTNGGDPALMASALTKMGRGDLADAYSKQANEMMSRASSSDTLADNKWKGMREMFAYSSPDKDGNPEASKALNDRAYAYLKSTNPEAYKLPDVERAKAVRAAIAEQELMQAFGNPEDGGFASLVPRFLSQNELLDPSHSVPVDRLKGAKIGPKIGGLRGAISPGDMEAGDRFLQMAEDYSDINLKKLSADAIERLQFYINQANTTKGK